MQSKKDILWSVKVQFGKLFKIKGTSLWQAKIIPSLLKEPKNEIGPLRLCSQSETIVYPSITAPHPQTSNNLHALAHLLFYTVGKNNVVFQEPYSLSHWVLRSTIIQFLLSLYVNCDIVLCNNISDITEPKSCTVFTIFLLIVLVLANFSFS